jgi:protoporphyrinogen oxidase
MPEPARILIVGGGFTGLTAAYRLAGRAGLEVVVVESAAEFGGLAAGFPILGTMLEKAYHYLFTTDSEIIALVRELGLEDRLFWADTTIGIRLGGVIHPFTTPLDMLRFAPCSFLNRVRFGLVGLYLKHMKNWRALSRQTAHDWMRRACGEQVMRTIWTPLLKGKFHRYWDRVSMAWLWARIHTRANSRPSSGREQLGYFKGGFAEVTGKLEAELARQGVRLMAGTRVDRLEFDGAKRALLANGESIPFDLCLFTGPSSALAGLLPEKPELADYKKQLRSIEYLGAVCLVFVSDQKVGDHYWLNIHEDGAPFLLFINHSLLVGTDLYQGKHVYYIGCYHPPDSPIFSRDEASLSAEWFEYLHRIYPEFVPGRVSEKRFFKLAGAQHVVDTDYEDKIPEYRTPVEGLFLANYSQIFPEDRGSNFAVREGNRIAEILLAESREAHG